MHQELDRPVAPVPLVVRLRRRIDALKAQAQEVVRTFSQLFESPIASRTASMFLAEGLRRRADAVVTYAELVVGTVGRLLGKFRRQKMLAVATGAVGLALFLILLLEVSLRIQLAQEAGDAGTGATLAASSSAPKKELDDPLRVQSTASALLQSSDHQAGAPPGAPSSELSPTFGQLSRESIPLPRLRSR
jgi:hypothetical protein